MKSYINKEKSEEFDTAVFEFVNSADPQLLPCIIKLGMVIVEKVRKYYRDLRLDESFDKDMVLEYLHSTLGGRDKTSPTKNLRNIAYSRIKSLLEESDTPHLESYDSHVYLVNPVSRLIFQDALKEVMKDLPLRIKAGIIYLLFFPDNEYILRNITESRIDLFIILQGIGKLYKMIDNVKPEEQTFQFKLPDTQISRLLLVSSLYKISPAVLVLLMQGRNLTSLLQFCALFGGQTVSVPTVAEFQRSIQQSSELASRLEEGELTIGDREALTYLASDLDDIEDIEDDMPLNPVLSSFFEKNLEITIKNYDAYQKRLIQEVDTKNIEDMMRIYEVMNKELRTQIQLVTEISSSVEEREDIKKIIDILTENTKK